MSVSDASVCIIKPLYNEAWQIEACASLSRFQAAATGVLGPYIRHMILRVACGMRFQTSYRSMQAWRASSTSSPGSPLSKIHYLLYIDR